jgi:hypothetical protein
MKELVVVIICCDLALVLLIHTIEKFQLLFFEVFLLPFQLLTKVSFVFLRFYPFLLQSNEDPY